MLCCLEVIDLFGSPHWTLLELSSPKTLRTRTHKNRFTAYNIPAKTGHSSMMGTRHRLFSNYPRVHLRAKIQAPRIGTVVNGTYQE